MDYQQTLQKTITNLKKHNKILFLTFSNRWKDEKGGEKPKSTRLAEKIAKKIGTKKVTLIDIPKLNIYPCEGNISSSKGNSCGVKEALLDDLQKNPSGLHRCWASINNPDDELWKVSKAILESDCVVFFGSVRWGQMNAEYQKLIERLTWMENRHSTLGETNMLGKISAGIIAIGHNWNGENVIETQKQVLFYFGFKFIEELCWSWKYTNSEDETAESYQKAAQEFEKIFLKS